MALAQPVPATLYSNLVSFPKWVDAVFLGAASAETYTVPADAGYALITCNLPVYACVSGTAVVPTTEVTDGTASFYMSAGMQCKLDSGQSVSLIRASASNTIVTIGVYRA